MLNYRFSNLEIEIFYSLDISKDIIGEMIFEFREILPDFSTSSNFYFFRSEALECTLLFNKNRINLRMTDSFKEDELIHIIGTLGKFLPSEKYKIKLRFKHFITNENEENEFNFNSNILDSVINSINGATPVSVGFNISEEDASIYYGVQMRKDYLEGMINTTVNYKSEVSLNEIVTEISMKYEQVQQFISDRLINIYSFNNM